MLSALSAEIAVNKDSLSLQSFEGASFRFALAPVRGESRTPEKEKTRPPPVIDHQKELVKLLRGLSGHHSQWQVFSDFCEMCAITFSNALDLIHQEKRKERLLQIEKGYSEEERMELALGLAHLTIALDDEISDVLGQTFHDLELHNKWAGQFFTPYHLARLKAQLTIGDHEDLKARIKERGFVTAMGPAVGSGAAIVALAQEMLDADVNYQEHLHVTAVDIDPKCIHMAYVQFPLLLIPAVVVHGDSLSLKEYDHWYTPAHILGLWNFKLRRRPEEETHEIHAPPKNDAVAAESSAEEKPDGPIEQLKLF